MIKEVIISFDKMNDDYIIIINNIWYKFQILCSYYEKTQKILVSNEMILIPKILKSDLLKNIDLKKLNKKKLESILESNRNKYIDIICDKNNEYLIYYGLTKIIKK
jgi:hypothetical protein